MISDTQKLRDSGKHVGGDLWTLNDKYLEKFDNASSAVVIANVRQNPAPVLEVSGSVSSTFKEESSQLAFTLDHKGADWRVTRLQVAK